MSHKLLKLPKILYQYLSGVSGYEKVKRHLCYS